MPRTCRNRRRPPTVAGLQRTPTAVAYCDSESDTDNDGNPEDSSGFPLSNILEGPTAQTTWQQGNFVSCRAVAPPPQAIPSPHSPLTGTGCPGFAQNGGSTWIKFDMGAPFAIQTYEVYASDRASERHASRWNFYYAPAYSCSEADADATTYRLHSLSSSVTVPSTNWEEYADSPFTLTWP